MIRIDIKNIDKIKQAFEKYGEDAIEEFGEVTKARALETVEVAQRLVPRNKSTLALSIKQIEVDNLTYKVFTNEPYAPYMEFGTGAKVDVPAEFAHLANLAKNKSTGSFKEGLESIKEWCRAKGIDEKAAYPIFVSILNNGLSPRPFMYPAYLDAKKKYKKDIKNSLKFLNKKFNND